MLKKLLLLFLFSTLFFTGFSSGNNVNNTNLYLDINGWCTGLEIPFRIYNITDWNNKVEIDDDLCGPDEDPENYSCLEYNLIDEAEIKIYDGPIDGLPVIFDGKSDENGTFKMKFDKPNNYLIEITPDGDYNDLEKTLEIMDCDFINNSNSNNSSENDSINISEIKIFNQTFNFPIGKVILKNTKSNISSDFSLKLIDLKKSEINQLNNSIKNFEITGIENFEKLSLNISLNDDINNSFNSSNFKLFKYDSNFNKWNEISNFKIKNSSISIENTTLGIYSIVYDEPKKVLVTKKIKEENKTNSVSVENSTSSNTLLYSIIGIIIILSISGFIYINSNKNKENYHDSKMKNTENDLSKTKQEVLTNYSDVYSKTKAYVKQYKKSFSKDQIYRALKQNNIPLDIIDKVFIEEF